MSTAEEREVRITAFLCNWCAYAGADLAGVSRLEVPATVRNIRVMCSGRVNPIWVLRAYFNGADGVLVAGCHPKDCHYTRGNFFTRRRFVLLNGIFETLGMEGDRLRLEWVSASEGIKYAEAVRDFTRSLKEKGPSQAEDGMFL